jgi:macrolide-specific efflux system membrane fusion protein
VFGTVASKTDATIVVTTLGNSSTTINVTASTTYSNGTRTAATLADVTVGATIVAQGTLNSDGSLNATVVQTGTNRMPGSGTGGFPGGGTGGFPGGGRSGGRGGVPIPAPSGSGVAPGTY